jgi:biotin carboxyl carrier protein
MKMETMIRAERDGFIKAVHAKTGKAVSAKDRLLEYQ